MPDPQSILLASLAAAALAALALLAARPWRPTAGALAAALAALGAGAGFFLGAYLLGFVPHFPPEEDQDRFLLLLLPAAVLVEIACAFLPRQPWLASALRAVVAVAAVPVLLYGSVYVGDLLGANRQWAGNALWLNLGALGLCLAANWALLSLLSQREGGRGAMTALTLAAGGAGVAVMLSGYASGGKLGLPLAAALAPAAVASYFRASPLPRGALGVGVVCLSGLLISGHFFAGLTAQNAVLLFVAPQLGWLTELPRVRRLALVLRRVAGVSVATLAVALVLTLAMQKFLADSRPTSESGGANEPSLDDYSNFGK